MRRPRRLSAWLDRPRRVLWSLLPWTGRPQQAPPLPAARPRNLITVLDRARAQGHDMSAWNEIGGPLGALSLSYCLRCGAWLHRVDQQHAQGPADYLRCR